MPKKNKVNYEGLEFEYYLHDEGLEEGNYCRVVVIGYEPEQVGDKFDPDLAEDFLFKVEDSEDYRLVSFHLDVYNEYQELIKEVKRLDRDFGGDL